MMFNYMKKKREEFDRKLLKNYPTIPLDIIKQLIRYEWFFESEMPHSKRLDHIQGIIEFADTLTDCVSLNLQYECGIEVIRDINFKEITGFLKTTCDTNIAAETISLNLDDQNIISDTLYYIADNYPQLEELIISNTAIGNYSFAVFKKFKHLTHLDIRGTQITPLYADKIRALHQIPIKVLH